MKSISFPACVSTKILTLGVLALVQAFAPVPLLGSGTDSTLAGVEKESLPNTGVHFAVTFGLNGVEQREIQTRLDDFSFGNTELGGTHPLAFLFGLNMGANEFELELSSNDTGLNGFMDNNHEFDVDETRVLLWYRRVFRFRLGSTSASVLPGAGMGYSFAKAVLGCTAEYCQREGDTGPENDETAVLEGSAAAFGFGVRFDAVLTSWHTARELSFVDIILDYSYRLGDMPAKIINEGSFFFPAPTEFAASGHYFAIGLQYKYGQ